MEIEDDEVLQVGQTDFSKATGDAHAGTKRLAQDALASVDIDDTSESKRAKVAIE